MVTRQLDKLTTDCTVGGRSDRSEVAVAGLEQTVVDLSTTLTAPAARYPEIVVDPTW